MTQFVKPTITKKIKDSDVWSELKKSWKAYKIAKLANNRKKMQDSALEIKELQSRLGAKISTFPELE